MEALIASLLLWIGTHTAYNTANMPVPEVRLVSPQEMTLEYYRGTEAAMPASGIDSRLYALYNYEDTDTGIIFLLDPRLNQDLMVESADTVDLWNDRSEPLHREWLDNVVFQEQLLHELIHHVQYQSGKVSEFPCSAYGEKEAYLLGGQFLKLRHSNDPLPNRNILAHIYSRC